MRRIASVCLAVAALTTAILTVSVSNALAGKPNKESTAKSDKAKVAKTDKAKVVKTDKAKITKIGKARLARADMALASKSDQNNSARPAASSDLVAEAKRWVGTNPTGWERVWCARFMNFVLKRTGHPGTGSDSAASFADYGRRLWGPQVGAIAVITRGRNGGHVGVVSGIDSSGNPIIVSGNHNVCSGNKIGNNRCVGIGVYPRERVYAYVVPK